MKLVGSMLCPPDAITLYPQRWEGIQVCLHPCRGRGMSGEQHWACRCSRRYMECSTKHGMSL